MTVNVSELNGMIAQSADTARAALAKKFSLEAATNAVAEAVATACSDGITIVK